VEIRKKCLKMMEEKTTKDRMRRRKRKGVRRKYRRGRVANQATRGTTKSMQLKMTKEMMTKRRKGKK